MAREAIEEIKRAEEQAKKIVSDAHDRSAELISEAIKAEKTADKEQDLLLKNQYDSAYSEAKKKAEEISRQSIENAKIKTRDEAEIISAKKEEAIKKVIECVLS